MVYRCDLGIGHYLGCDVAVVLSANFQLFKSLVFISPMPRLQTPRSELNILLLIFDPQFVNQWQYTLERVQNITQILREGDRGL